VEETIKLLNKKLGTHPIFTYEGILLQPLLLSLARRILQVVISVSINMGCVPNYY